MPVEIYPLVNWLKKRCGQENQICSHIFKKADTNGFIRGENVSDYGSLIVCGWCGYSSGRGDIGKIYMRNAENFPTGYLKSDMFR